jgi:RNA polymerase sigma-70 factor (ECF subfamily)
MKEEIINWFHTYSDDLFRWAYHKISSKEIAEDLVQETFLSAVKGYSNFKKDSKPKTWLFAILNNKIIDFYRKKTKLTTLNGKRIERKFINQTDSFFDSNQRWTLNREAILWEEEPHILDNPEFMDVLKNCMGKLPDTWKYAITSKYLLNKSSALICQELKVTPSNYWQIVHRTKLMLKKCIDLNWKI